MVTGIRANSTTSASLKGCNLYTRGKVPAGESCASWLAFSGVVYTTQLSSTPLQGIDCTPLWLTKDFWQRNGKCRIKYRKGTNTCCPFVHHRTWIACSRLGCDDRLGELEAVLEAARSHHDIPKQTHKLDETNFALAWDNQCNGVFLVSRTRRPLSVNSSLYSKPHDPTTTFPSKHTN